VTVAYETWGEPGPARGNAVLVLHALTGDPTPRGRPVRPIPHPVGGTGSSDPGRPSTPTVGSWSARTCWAGCQGTTGPASPAPDSAPYGSRFPLVTIRDQVAVEAALADHLGIDRWAGVVGGSMGGMRVLEWCVGHPDRVGRAVVLAVGAAATSDQIAWCSLQVRAIRSDPAFAGGDYYATSGRPVDGLAVARGLGQVTYRTADELEVRFGRAAQAAEEPLKGGRYAVESYSSTTGPSCPSGSDPNAYIVLSEAMNHHGRRPRPRWRGGALARVRAEVTRGRHRFRPPLPLPSKRSWPGCLPGDGPVRLIESASGHDGFLLEVDQVGDVVAAALA